MSDRQWVRTIRHEQSMLSLPFGLGYTIDITETLTALAAAGLTARVETFDRLRFDHGASRHPGPDHHRHRRRRRRGPGG